MKYIDRHDILYDYDTYEQMPIIHRYSEIECLSSYIKKEYITSYIVNIAMMYVNQGILYAKSRLSKQEYGDYVIYFVINYCNEDIENEGFLTSDVCFSRKAKMHLSNFHKPIDIRRIKIYKYIKNIIGINNYYCYKFEFEDYETYCFVPKGIMRKKDSQS